MDGESRIEVRHIEEYIRENNIDTRHPVLTVAFVKLINILKYFFAEKQFGISPYLDDTDSPGCVPHVGDFSHRSRERFEKGKQCLEESMLRAEYRGGTELDPNFGKLVSLQEVLYKASDDHTGVFDSGDAVRDREEAIEYIKHNDDLATWLGQPPGTSTPLELKRYLSHLRNELNRKCTSESCRGIEGCRWKESTIRKTIFTMFKRFIISKTVVQNVGGHKYVAIDHRGVQEAISETRLCSLFFIWFYTHTEVWRGEGDSGEGYGKMNQYLRENININTGEFEETNTESHFLEHFIKYIALESSHTSGGRFFFRGQTFVPDSDIQVGIENATMVNCFTSVSSNINTAIEFGLDEYCVAGIMHKPCCIHIMKTENPIDTISEDLISRIGLLDGRESETLLLPLCGTQIVTVHVIKLDSKDTIDKLKEDVSDILKYWDDDTNNPLEEFPVDIGEPSNDMNAILKFAVNNDNIRILQGNVLKVVERLVSNCCDDQSCDANLGRFPVYITFKLLSGPMRRRPHQSVEALCRKQKPTASQLWPWRYAKIEGKSLNFYESALDTGPPRGSSIADVTGCIIDRGREKFRFDAAPGNYHVITLTRRGHANGLPDLLPPFGTAPDGIARICFAEDKEADCQRFAYALTNLAAGRAAYNGGAQQGGFVKSKITRTRKTRKTRRTRRTKKTRRTRNARRTRKTRRTRRTRRTRSRK